MKKLIIIFLLTLPIAASQSGTLTIAITNLENTDGMLLVALFNKEEGFPEDENSAIRKSRISAGGNTVVTYKNLPYGTYAVTVLHDENNNGKMDTKLLVMPAEGVGTSNNPKLTGPPSFSKSKFELNTEQKSITIKMMYL